MALSYADGKTEVKLGDRVETSVWFRRRSGRVVYVPGVSALNEELEFNGMRWVGVRLEDQSLLATPVLHQTETLKAKVRFVARDSTPCEFITPESREFESSGGGWTP